MTSLAGNLRSQRAKAAVIIFQVVVLAILTWTTPPRYVVIHNVLHHLNILPLMLAGMFFGWRGALRTVLLATMLQAPSIYRHWFHMPLDAQDQIVELSTFGVAGVIAGILADRERMQRRQVEETKQELEQVHAALQQNIDHMKRTERLTAAGQLSASLAHEIRNPLASISGAAGILARGQAPSAAQSECLAILIRESQRLNKLLTNFLDFARPRLPRLQPAEPMEMVQSVVALGQHAALQKGVTLQASTTSPQHEVQCDPEQIKQLLLNLVLNAIQASRAGSIVTVNSHFMNGCLHIDVRDHGDGIEAEQREHIFEPFFTTKESGTGLGLAIAANIANQHGGTLTCESDSATGTLFRLELPAHHAIAQWPSGLELR